MTVSTLNENELIVPLVLWGDRPPTHCVSCIHLSRDLRTLVTGCNDGQLILWDFAFEESLQFCMPRCMLFGHSASILCVANGNISLTGPQYIVSSSENGEMCLWDLQDGKCVESNKVQNIHTGMIAYEMQGQEDARLICNGYYSEILVMDPLNLTVLFSLSARINSDWISSVFVTKQSDEDIIIGISCSGSVKTWALNGNETRSSEPIYERESKSIECTNAFKLTGCAYDNKTILIVCAKFWRIYDANDYTLLCTVNYSDNERWLGGSFISTDKVVIWSDHGKGYLYKLPSNCIPSNEKFHFKSSDEFKPQLYCSLKIPNDERLLCPPIMNFFTLSKSTVFNPFEVNENLIVRGDSNGHLVIWNVKDQADVILQSPPSHCASTQKLLPVQSPILLTSLEQAWSSVSPSPAGILDQLSTQEGSPRLRITASVYLPAMGNLICGREDGSIVILPATQAIMFQMLVGRHQTYENWPAHTILRGHSSKVNCLLYPHHQHPRYDKNHLISGGVDFSVCLWDLENSVMLYCFSVHAGEVTQLLVPPPSCNPRVLHCICSVASDHSVALLSIKERKCIMLASRHLFPIHTIKWRPLDDFMIVACADGSLYVWQMETGLLDRVVHGMLAEEILDACDHHTVVHDVSINPALHVFRSLKFGNFDAIKNAAAKGIQHLTQQNQEKREVVDFSIQSSSNPLMIQPIKANAKDSDSHLLLFDVESLIVHLLADEYALMSPGMLESNGLTNNAEYQKYLYLANSPDTQHKFSGLLNKLKDTAENAAQKLQKTDMAGIKSTAEELLMTGGRKGSSTFSTSKEVDPKRSTANLSLTMDIAQILLSLIHGWGLDTELDRVCDTKLGLLRPMRVPCFGILSKNQHLTLLMPTFIHRYELGRQSHLSLERRISGGSTSGISSGAGPSSSSPTPTPGSSSRPTGGSIKYVRMKDFVPSHFQAEEQRVQRFSCKIHWELGPALSTGHLLCIISLANTLMSLTAGTFVPPSERKRKLFRRLSKTTETKPMENTLEMDEDWKAFEAEAIANQQEQVKQGWSLLAALHCVLLPDYVKSNALKRPLLDALAARWQDRCLEVREAAQALLLAELRRIGPRGRRQLVDEWSLHLPKERPNAAAAAHQNFQTAYMIHPNTQLPQPASNASLASGSSTVSLTGSAGGQVEMEGQSSGSRSDLEGELQAEDHHEDDNLKEWDERRRLSNFSQKRRKRSVAVILLGVIGAEYGQEIEQSKRRSGPSEERRKSIVEGFGAGNYSLSMQTSSALFSLLVTPQTHTDHSLRRAAIDLIGRGFTVWEPYLNVSQVLIRLLELCNDGEKLVASMSFGLPLTPEADSCRTARHALGQIATSRPPAFISTLACEIARFNSMQQNAQHTTTALQMVLMRAKPEMLRNIDLLIKSMPSEIWDLMIETMDIILHCLDFKHLKEQSLVDVFPSIILKFPNVSYCATSRRIAVGAKNGKMAIYDLKQPKSQLIVGHTQPITCCAFSPDGKYLASYAMNENKILFWSTATSLLGWGNSQIKLLRTFNTAPVSENIVKNLLATNTNTSSSGQLNNCDSRIARLVWINSKVTILIYSDGSEYRYMI